MLSKTVFARPYALKVCVCVCVCVQYECMQTGFTCIYTDRLYKYTGRQLYTRIYIYTDKHVHAESRLHVYKKQERGKPG